MVGWNAVLLLALLGIPLVSARDCVVANRDEFDAVLAAAQPGDGVVFKDGTRRDVRLNFRARGTAERPITLRAETPGKVIFQGSSELIIDGPYLVVSGFHFQRISNLTEAVTPNNVTVRRVVVFTTNAAASRLTETAIVDAGAGVTTYVHLRPGSQSNVIDHCWFSGQRGIGVTFYVEAHPTIPNYHRIEHNYFGNRQPGQGNGWETIRIGHSAQQDFFSGTTVAYNYFYKCNGELECISGKSTGNRYLYNAFVENLGQLTLRHGNRALIEGNYFLGGSEPQAQGVRIIGSDHVVVNNYFKGVRDALFVYNGQVDPEPRGYAPVNNTLIASNRFEDCVNNLILGVGERGRAVTPKNLRIEYNVVQGSGRMVQQRSPKVDATYKGNLVFGVEPGIEPHEGIETNRPVARVADRSPYPHSPKDVGPAWMR